MRSARPTISPACGPPTSLSPLNVTRSAPAASRSAGVGSCASPNATVSSSAPVPRSSMTMAPCRWAMAATSARSGASVKPACEKFDGWTRASTVRVRPAVGQRRLEVHGPGPVRRPDLDQPRPCPRQDLRDPHATADLHQLPARHHHGPAPTRQAYRQQQGGGVVRDHHRVLGAGERDEVLLRRPEPRPAPPGRPRPAPGTRRRAAAASAAARAARGQGARPRFVCSTTPVALMTCGGIVSPGSRRSSRRARTASASSTSGVGGAPDPSRCALVVDDRARERGERRGLGCLDLVAHEREDPLDARRVRPVHGDLTVHGDRSVHGMRGLLRHGAMMAGPGRMRGARRGHHRAPRVTTRVDARGVAGRDLHGWRERMGVEPTARRRAPRHRF